MIEVELLKFSARVQYRLVRHMGEANNTVERWRKIYGKSFKDLIVRIENDKAASPVGAGIVPEKSPFKKGQLPKRRKLNRTSYMLHFQMKYTQGCVKHV